MRSVLTTTLFLSILLTACKKNESVGNDPVRNDIGYLVRQIIRGKDTTRFQYDNNNRLTGLTYSNGSFNFLGTFESFKYNANGKLASYKYTYSGSTTLTNVHSFSYQNDTIIKTSLNLNTTYGDALKFIITNDQIVETRLGAVFEGIILSNGFWDTTRYLYQDENLIKCTYRFLTSTYQPIDTFAYNKNFYNPYLLLGKHIWSLLLAPGGGLIYGESKNIPSIITNATHSVVGSTLLNSGFFSLRIISVEAAQENTLLPKAIKYLADDGSEITTQYFYQPQK